MPIILSIYTGICHVSGLDRDQKRRLREYLSFPLAQSEYIKRHNVSKAKRGIIQAKVEAEQATTQKERHIALRNQILAESQLASTKDWEGRRYFVKQEHFPVGFKTRVKMWLYTLDPNFKTVDYRPKPLPFVPGRRMDFSGELRDFQARILKVTSKEEMGIYNIGTGGGKTVMAIYLIWKQQVPTVVVVPTLELVNQWIERLQQFLTNVRVGYAARSRFADGDIFVVSQSTLATALRPKKPLSPEVEVLIEGSLTEEERKKKASRERSRAKTQARQEKIREKWSDAGMVIIDEAHMAAADTWLSMMDETAAYYRYGLTATTDKRQDRRDYDYYAILGEKLKTFGLDRLVEEGITVPIKIWFEYVPFKNYPKYWKYTTKDNTGSVEWDYIVTGKERNLIAVDRSIDRAFRKNKTTLILVRRVKHGEILKEMIEHEVVNRPDFRSLGLTKSKVEYLHGGVKPKDRRPVYEAFANGSLKLLIAQVKLVGMGWDIPRLKVLVLPLGGKSEIQKIQGMGRGSRKFEGKEYLEVIEFADQCLYCRSHTEKRAKTYFNEGAELMNIGDTFLGHLFGKT